MANVSEIWLQLGERTDEPGRTVRLAGERFEIGRSRAADLQVGDNDVSRRHLAITFRGGVWLAEDLGSQNGTLVNGRLVNTVEIRVGDMIRLGRPGPALRVARLAPDPARLDPEFGEAKTQMIGDVDIRRVMQRREPEPPPPTMERPPARPRAHPPSRPKSPPRRPRPAAPPQPAPRHPSPPPPPPAAPVQPPPQPVATAAPPPEPQVVVKKRGGFLPFLVGVLIGAAALFAALERERLPSTLRGYVSQVRAPGALTVGEPGPVVEHVRSRAAGFGRLHLRLTEHAVDGRSKGQPVRVLSTSAYVPVTLGPDRTLAQALAETREALTESIGPSANTDWRTRLDSGATRAIVTWEVEVDSAWRPKPLADGEVPEPLTRVKSDEGPTW